TRQGMVDVSPDGVAPRGAQFRHPEASKADAHCAMAPLRPPMRLRHPKIAPVAPLRVEVRPFEFEALDGSFCARPVPGVVASTDACRKRRHDRAPRRPAYPGTGAGGSGWRLRSLRSRP